MDSKSLGQNKKGICRERSYGQTQKAVVRKKKNKFKYSMV